MSIFTDRNWANDWATKQAASDFQRLPNGQYQAKVDAVKYEEGRNGKADVIIYELTVAEGAECGARFRKFVFMKDSQCIPFIKRDIDKLGCVMPQDPVNIPLALQKAVGKVIKVRYNTKVINDKEYPDITIDGVVQQAQPQPQPQSQSQADDNPFYEGYGDDSCPF